MTANVPDRYGSYFRVWPDEYGWNAKCVFARGSEILGVFETLEDAQRRCLQSISPQDFRKKVPNAKYFKDAPNWMRPILRDLEPSPYNRRLELLFES